MYTFWFLLLIPDFLELLAQGLQMKIILASSFIFLLLLHFMVFLVSVLLQEIEPGDHHQAILGRKVSVCACMCGRACMRV